MKAPQSIIDIIVFPLAGKHLQVKLMKYELVSGEQLLEAAHRKGDIEMLQLLELEDLVAHELQYHRDWHKDYSVLDS